MDQREEFARIEMGRTRGPGMARLRDDRIPAAIRRGPARRARRRAAATRAGRRAGRRPTRSRTARLAATTSGSSSITSIDSTELGTAATVIPAPSPMITMRAVSGRTSTGRIESHCAARALGRVARRADERFGQPVVGEPPPTPLRNRPTVDERPTAR